MTGADNSLFPMRRPWWVVVLLGMILFGYIQEDAKVKLNHYIAIGEQFTDFYEYGREECEGEAQCMYEKRKAWWDDYSPLCRASASPNRETFSVFHWWGAQEMLRAKWVLMVLIVLGFFLLDALFLKASGVGDRWRLLLMVYATSGLVVAAFYLFDGRGGAEEAGYNVAREVLGFLQSPLPSLMLVVMPWLRDRALPQSSSV